VTNVKIILHSSPLGLLENSVRFGETSLSKQCFITCIYSTAMERIHIWPYERWRCSFIYKHDFKISRNNGVSSFQHHRIFVDTYFNHLYKILCSLSYLKTINSEPKYLINFFNPKDGNKKINVEYTWHMHQENLTKILVLVPTVWIYSLSTAFVSSPCINMTNCRNKKFTDIAKTLSTGLRY
jgi:hypothetical protein